MYIVSTCDEKRLQQIINCQDAFSMWQKLSTIHDQSAKVNKHLLLQEFYDFKMDLSDDISTNISRIETLAQRLTNLGENIPNSMIITKIICSLP